MTDTKIGPCQCCGTVTRLFSGASRFGDPTWACDECWRPDEPRLTEQELVEALAVTNGDRK